MNLKLNRVQSTNDSSKLPWVTSTPKVIIGVYIFKGKLHQENMVQLQCSKPDGR